MSVLDFIDFIVVMLICIDRININLGSLSFNYMRKPIYVNVGCSYLLIRYIFIDINKYNTGLIDINLFFILNVISFLACILSLILDTSFKDNKKLNNVSSICMMLVWCCLLLNIVKDLIM